jgi:hypothetical protein
VDMAGAAGAARAGRDRRGDDRGHAEAEQGHAHRRGATRA